MSLLTILATSDDARLAKTLTLMGGEWAKRSYDDAYRFDVVEEPVASIHDLAAVLRVLEDMPTSCVIRGRRRPGVPLEGIFRRLRDRPAHDGRPAERATFDETVVPWLMLDVDGLPAHPEWTNEQRLAHVIDSLPECFHGATYYYQWSAGAGLDGWQTLRVHLWFWLDQWSEDRCSKIKEQALTEAWPVDYSLMNPVQIHFTAAPIFDGCDDPLAGIRSGLVVGDRDEVSIPAMVVDEPVPSPSLVTSPAKVLAGQLRGNRASKGFEAMLAAIGPRYHEPIRDAAASYIGTYGREADLVELRARLVDAIHAGEVGASNKADYLAPAYLDNVINGAARKFGHGAPKRRRPLGF